MTDVEHLLIEWQCRRLAYWYCYLADHGETARIAELFMPDGIWITPDAELRGREELMSGLSRRERSPRQRIRHVCTNALVQVIGANRAEGTVGLTLYRHFDPDNSAIRPSDIPAVVGEYADRYVRTRDGWRFERRVLTVDFMRPA